MPITTAEFRERLRALVGEYLAEQAPLVAEGDDCLATRLEDAAMAVGDSVTQELLSRQLEKLSEGDAPCPCCGARCLKKGQRTRTLQSRRGPIPFQEPELYCKNCRRSFFPSVGGVGLGG